MPSGLEPSATPLLVVGGSAGSLGPLLELVSGLPADLGAAVLVCLHTSQEGRSQLPAILARRSRLPAAWAVDEEVLRAGRIYVAPPGLHLLVRDGRLRTRSGPRVNRHRPSVDVLFASAANSAGPASTVVVLSGVLDDGATGAALVDMVGGQVLVQAPGSAAFDSMPAAALAAAPSARILTSEPISRDVVDAVRRKSAPAHTADVRPATTSEEVSMQTETPDDPGFLQPGESRLTRLACPDCGGGLAQVDLPQISYFRCHIGHQYGPRTLAAAQAESTEQKLWSAVAALEEQAVVQRYLEGLDLAETGPGRTSGELTTRAGALREQVHRWASLADPSEAVQMQMD